MSDWEEYATLKKAASELQQAFDLIQSAREEMDTANEQALEQNLFDLEMELGSRQSSVEEKSHGKFADLKEKEVLQNVSTTAASKAMRYLSIPELKQKVKQKSRDAEKIDPQTYRLFTDTRRDPTTDQRHKVAVLFTEPDEEGETTVITQKQRTHAHGGEH